MRDHMEALKRAHLSLEGLSIGDALGGWCEYDTDEHFDALIETRTLPTRLWRFTDDTNMALSIYEILRIYSHIDQDKLMSSFVGHFDRFRHYGRSTYNWFNRCIDGEPWREVTKTLFPEGEGLAGAITVAVAAAVGWQAHREKLTRSEFLNLILPHIPASRVRDGVQRALTLPAGSNTTLLASFALGNGRQIAAWDTVPLALWISGTYLYDYEEAIWQAISHNGDVDTLAAIVGGIVALSAGEGAIPTAWRQHREPLHRWAIGDEAQNIGE